MVQKNKIKIITESQIVDNNFKFLQFINKDNAPSICQFSNEITVPKELGISYFDLPFALVLIVFHLCRLI